MFPSNSSHNGNDPISYSDQAFHCMPFSLDFESNINTTTSSKLETNSYFPPPLSSLHFPSPFEDDEIFLEQHLDFLLQFQPLTEAEPQPVVNMEVSIKKKFPSKHITTEQIPRKRPGKRDRHSKINTARGPRDRRMRLSLEVARRFFGLQDLLGFDKASKTVEWLLNRAKVEIDQLAVKSASSTSECEGVSSLEEVVVNGNKKKEMKGAQATVKRRVKHSRKSAFHPLARECRKRARERARERTKEKLRSKQCREATNHKLMSQLGNNPFETGEEYGSQSQSVNPSMNLVTEAKKLSSLSKEHLRTTVEANMAHNDSLAIVNKRSPSMILSCLNNSGLLQEISLN